MAMIAAISLAVVSYGLWMNSISPVEFVLVTVPAAMFAAFLCKNLG
jgi:hypothetical protein